MHIGTATQRVSSLLTTCLACPFRIHPCRRIAAGEEAYKERLALEGLQAILDLTKETFRNIVRQNYLAVGLIGGHDEVK